MGGEREVEEGERWNGYLRKMEEILKSRKSILAWLVRASSHT